MGCPLRLWSISTSRPTSRIASSMRWSSSSGSAEGDVTLSLFIRLPNLRPKHLITHYCHLAGKSRRNKPRSATLGIIVKIPAFSQLLVQLEEVSKASHVALADVRHRYVVPTFSDSGGDTGDRLVRAPQVDENEISFIAAK